MFDVENKKLIASNEFYFRSKKYSLSPFEWRNHIHFTRMGSYTVTTCGSDKSYEVTEFHVARFHQMIIALFRYWYYANFISFFSPLLSGALIKSSFIERYLTFNSFVWYVLLVWFYMKTRFQHHFRHKLPLMAESFHSMWCGGVVWCAVVSFRKCDNSTINFMTLPQSFKRCVHEAFSSGWSAFMRPLKNRLYSVLQVYQ